MKNLFDLCLCFWFLFLRFAGCSDQIEKHTLNQKTTLKKEKKRGGGGGKTNKVVDFVYFTFLSNIWKKQKEFESTKIEKHTLKKQQLFKALTLSIERERSNQCKAKQT